MIKINLSEVFFDSQHGGYLVPTGSTWARTSEELRSTIREGNYQDAINFISNMDKVVVGEPDSHGQTALHFAALCDNEELCKVLIEKLDPEAICTQTKESSQTALHLAVRANRKNIAELLISRPDVKDELLGIKDVCGQTALHWAADKSSYDICRLLYDAMKPEQILAVMDPKARHQTALHFAVQANRKDVVKLLISRSEVKDELLGIKDVHDQTALHWAADKSSYDICKLLYDAMNPEQILTVMDPSTRHQTALHLAVQANRKDIAELLISRPDVKDELLGIKDVYGQTALHWAAAKGFYDICKLLYDVMQPEQICFRTRYGKTALQVTASFRPDIVELLTSRPDVKDVLLSIKDE